MNAPIVPMNVRKQRHRDEVRRGNVDVVATGGEIVTELVAE